MTIILKQNFYGFKLDYGSSLTKLTLGAYPEASPKCQIVPLSLTNVTFLCERNEEIILSITDSGMVDQNLLDENDNYENTSCL